MAVKLLIATTNPNKVREILPLLAGLDIELVTLADVDPVPEPEETGTTFWENARIKALAYAGASGLTTIAEDSGFRDPCRARPSWKRTVQLSFAAHLPAFPFRCQRSVVASDHLSDDT